MRLGPIVDRLKAQASSLRHVGGAANLAALKSAPSRTPAAWVVPVSESAGANVSATIDVAQRIRRRFGVVIAVRDIRDATGEAALDGGLAQARSEIAAALVAWSPDQGSGAIMSAGGRLLSFSSGVLWWQDEFETDIWTGGSP